MEGACSQVGQSGWHPGWHLAQINIGRLVAPHGDPRVQPFFDALDRVNALADASPGFVWRLKDESGNATDIPVAPDPLLAVNLTVWTDADSLFEFVYGSAHAPVMARRREFFTRMDGAYQALWWIEAGSLPTVNDGLAKLWLLDRHGPSPLAFTFKARFPAPGGEWPPVGHQPDPLEIAWCVGSA